ncbi:phosphatidate phosphatase PAH1 [Juglans microcarpa x Juglans regia]|uniref:phosphatidate phosphatase PAH1 n=1 Tax=Juglans microcarpa x Juglans regia TaxID=2249226 RepID=UPI001B7EB00E|nr:phosphatidate phosphatase PAH1 [Juglans microcarpa x Juglans regia]
MYAVERLGNYITRGVYTVSGPFHPFGGAVDIIVVEQQDGSFKSSPWYVRFGKFQGVLKTKEKVVNISVNGVEANFHMYLDHKGEAYFLRQVGVVEGETVSYSLSSGDETDGQSQNDRRPVNSKSFNFDSTASDSVDKFDGSSGEVLARSKSRRSRIFGHVFGRRSMREESYLEGEGGDGVTRADSLERAEMAANLLEVKWSTNLAWKGTAHKDVPITDEKGEGSSPEHGNEEMGGNSLPGFEDLQGFVEETSKELSPFSTPEQVTETSVSSESVLEGKCETMFRLSRKADVGDTEHDEHVQYIDEEQAFHVQDILPGCGISHEEGGTDRVHSLIYCKTSERSIVATDGSGKHIHETMYLASEGHGEVHVHAEMLHSTAELLLEDILILQVAEDGALQTEPVEVREIHSRQISPSSSCIDKCDVVDFEEPPAVAEFYTQMVGVDPTLSSVDEVGSPSTRTISSSSNSAHQAQDMENKDEGMTSKFQPSMESIGTCVPTKATSMVPSGSSEEEQLLFSDIDGISEMQCVESISREHLDEESVSVSPERIKEANGSVNVRYGSSQPLEKLVEENPPTDIENSTEKLRITSTPIIISRKHMVCSEEGWRLVQSLPNLCPHTENPNALNIDHPLSHSLDSSYKSLSLKLQNKCDSSYIKSDKDLQLAVEQLNTEDMGEHTNVLASPAVGDPSKSSVATEGGWRIWPFRRSRSKKGMPPALTNGITSNAESALESTVGVNAEKTLLRLKRENKMVRAMTPTSEQLASLNLKEGKNTVTFTFSTAMLGKQQVDASVYLWKWNTRIVISDVDGTITKSDVLGQFMPLVGVDWSQTGVAHLFSAIKENGYQLLFLSARAISQAYHTRQFLFNLKQDGKALPEGPVVISPDGLFPSLYREVIRRAPHEFKISCLKVIRDLFPSDYNPFYAGFGNRDTDEISYLKIGIPLGKIFIINPKGEVAVNRRVDTRSYSSLHALVNGMFPPMTSSEQEDFNSWNFWKLPPPAIYV